MRLRPATLDDAPQLLEWRNDPDTRAASRMTYPVAPAEHHGWLTRTLHSPVEALYIAEETGPVGTGRLTQREHETEVSLTIAPEWRGKRLASVLIDELIAVAAPGELVAEIAVENIPSLRAFIRSGFMPERCVTNFSRQWLQCRR